MALMKIEELLLMFLILTTLYGTTISTIYKVGDSAGWSIPGTNDYHSWSSFKTFFIGDTILFQYDKQLHNVLQVRLQDYHSCNVNNPMTTYTSGNDSFTIGKPGHYFFICGIPGHCDAGQKLDIRVIKEPGSAPAREMVFQNRVPMEAAAPFGLMAPAPEAGSCARTFAYSKLQMVLLLLSGFCFCCYFS